MYLFAGVMCCSWYWIVYFYYRFLFAGSCGTLCDLGDLHCAAVIKVAIVPRSQ